MYYAQGVYLVHHGIKGQKWGVRRFQNPDGSLTSAGQERYAGQKEHKDTGFRRLLTGNTRLSTYGLDDDGMRGHRKKIVERFNKRADKYQRKADEAKNDKEFEDFGARAYAEKMQRKADKQRMRARAQEAANANRDAYDRHTSTGKMLAQNLLMTPMGGEYYRNARARGASRTRALIEGSFGGLPGYMVRRSGEKKAYGAHVRTGIGGGEF